MYKQHESISLPNGLADQLKQSYTGLRRALWRMHRCRAAISMRLIIL